MTVSRLLIGVIGLVVIAAIIAVVAVAIYLSKRD